jgi:RNA recognition motif-containing protein
MDRKLYVGNLAYATDEEEVRELFEECGEVVNVEIVIDYVTGASRGYGFVEMNSVEEAEAAKKMLDGRLLDGRAIRVGPALRRKTYRPRGAQRHSEERRRNHRQRTTDYWN